MLQLPGLVVVCVIMPVAAVPVVSSLIVLAEDAVVLADVPVVVVCGVLVFGGTCWGICWCEGLTRAGCGGGLSVKSTTPPPLCTGLEAAGVAKDLLNAELLTCITTA